MGDRVGEHLGNYRLARLLGEGGFAQVYLGEHVYLQTQAAIKVLLGRMSDSDLQGFLNEARTIASLKHPNIIRVLEFGVEPNSHTPFLVMTYAPGGSLRQRHPKGSIVPLKDVLVYSKQVAAALQYAHDNRVIHRDVKPENMLLGRNGEILLSDFGIAVAARNTLSQSVQQVVGTVAYMAPEQIRGRPRPASDQYALAIAVYEWLSGARPFEGSGYLGVAAQHLSEPPVHLREKVPALPPAIANVVMRALAKDYSERFPSVQDFADALEQAGTSVLYLASAQSGAPGSDISQVDPSAYTTSVQRTQRGISRRAVAGGLIGIAGLALVGGGVAWYVLRPARPQGTLLAVYSKHTAGVNWVTRSPDGRYVASASSDKTVQVWEANTGARMFIYAGHFGTVNGVAWSPNGRYIASASADKTVQVWDARTGNYVYTYNGHMKFDTALAVTWSPDSMRIASTSTSTQPDTSVQICDATTGGHVAYYDQPLQNWETHVNTVAWSPDGRYIASTIYKVVIWDVGTGNSVAFYDGNHVSGNQWPWVRGLAWSPDSARVASAGNDQTVQVWEAITGNHLFTCSGHTGGVNSLAWSPDGKYLASGSLDKTVQVWDASTGRRLFTYRGHTGAVNAIAWLPDSRQVVSGGDDRQLHVWQAI